MAVIKLLPNGSSGGFAGPGRSKNDGGNTRDVVRGWSAGSGRRCTAWLWSVNGSLLGDGGYAITLTMGGRPDTADQWHWARKRLMERMKRAGATRQHWVIEWTEESRPHLHMAVWGPSTLPLEILANWIELMQITGWPVSERGQHIVPIHGVEGWLEYVSKHSARGVAHYQRTGAPEGWARTGRLWGHWGIWPVESPEEYDLTDEEFYRFRRMVINHQRKKLLNAGLRWSVNPRTVAAGTPRTGAKFVGRAIRLPDSGKYAGFGYWIDGETSFKLLLRIETGGGSPGSVGWEKINGTHAVCDHPRHRCVVLDKRNRLAEGRPE